MPPDFTAHPGEVHLWWAAADDAPTRQDDLGVLDAAERARAARFGYDRDRRRFVSRRVFSRTVLSRYLGVEPPEIRVRTSPWGRPELDAPSNISFSLSHSAGVVAMAVACGTVVGVDIERLRHVTDAMEVAERFFAGGEVEELRSTPESLRAEAFLGLWTRKESYLKATGKGLSLPLAGFDVSSSGSKVVRPRGPRGALPFVIASLGPQAGFVGAVTLAGTRISIRSMTAGAMPC